MLVSVFFTVNTKTYFFRKNQHIVTLLMRLLCAMSSATVSFLVINDENCIQNLFATDLTLEMIFTENKSVEWINEEEKITIFKNNILRYEAPSKQPKYYNPNIHTLHHWNNMVFNSKLIKKHLDSKSTNIKIFLKDISYPALLLFLKLIDNSDSFISQINLQDFLDILLIITILDIEKTKERDYFLKDLLRNVMSEMLRQDFTLYFDNNLCRYHYSYIKKSLFMDIWIFFINFITFDDKSAQIFIVLSGNRNLCFKRTYMFSDSYNSIKKIKKNQLYLRFDDISIRKIYKIRNQKHYMNTWIFLLKIVDLDLLYLVFSTEEIYKKATVLFSSVTFNAEKLYIVTAKNSIKLFLNKQIPVISNKLKVLKLESSLTSEDFKKLFGFCGDITKLTLKLESLDFQGLKIIKKFCLMNLNKTCNIFCKIYELLNTDFKIIKNIPNNLKIYASKLQTRSVDIELSTVSTFFPSIFSYKYIYLKNLSLYNFFLLLECFKFKSVSFDFTKNSSPYKLEDSVYRYLRYIQTIKYMFLANIYIGDTLFEYVLDSNTIVSLELSNSVCSYNLKFLSTNHMTNEKLKIIAINTISSGIDSSFLIYLNNFKAIEIFILLNTEISFTTSLEENNHYNFIVEEESKIHLKYLEVKTKPDSMESSNYLNFLSKIYNFSSLLSIIYCVFSISEIEYQYFLKMKQLESMRLKIRNRTECIDFGNVFNYESFNTIILLTIDVCLIRIKDIEIFKKFKNLGYFSIYCDNFDNGSIFYIKKKDFKRTVLVIERPNRASRSKEINNYLDSEFKFKFT
ncbi:hypothetical protein LUQ84_001908 [Hamiltosporidium tvaerminnensis]|nr:hypothetical protein LUQ84_001908 [Hamiltosporidium tvaerminnensis]